MVAQLVPAPPKRTGRPSSYSDATAAIICARLAEGEPLRAICADPGMPATASIFRWLEGNEAFRERYARAREVQAHTIAERGFMEAMSAGGPDGLDAQSARIRFDAARWLAGKLAPKVYGDKVTQEHTGPGGGPVKLVWGDGSE